MLVQYVQCSLTPFQVDHSLALSDHHLDPTPPSKDSLGSVCVCVCVCGWVGGWVGVYACVGMRVYVCVCV